MNEDEQLLHAWLERSISEDQLKKLNHRLREDADLRARFRQLSTIDSGLSQFGQENERGSNITPIEMNTQTKQTSFKLIVLAACLCIAIFYIFLNAPKRSTQIAPTYATLIKTDQLVWGNNAELISKGQRVEAQTLAIKSGKGELLFDSGARLILKGPSTLKIHSDSSATLIEGEVTFIDHHNQTVFDLLTPHSKLVDLGTVYTLKSNAKTEEVHVYDGEVWRTGKNEAISLIQAGRAKKYYGGTSTEENLTIDLSHKKDFSMLKHLHLSRKTTNCIDSFDYEHLSKPQNLNGGQGWGGSWQFGWYPGNSDVASPGKIIIDQKQASIKNAVIYTRLLSDPIDLKKNDLRFLSLRFKFNQSDFHNNEFISFALRTSNEMTNTYQRRTIAGVISKNEDPELLLRYNRKKSQTKLNLNLEESYRYLLMIRSQENTSCQIASVILPYSTDISDPKNFQWSNFIEEEIDAAYLDQLSIKNQSASGFSIDDVQIVGSFKELK